MMLHRTFGLFLLYFQQSTEIRGSYCFHGKVLKYVLVYRSVWGSAEVRSGLFSEALDCHPTVMHSWSSSKLESKI
jgi:hypothetical protein